MNQVLILAAGKGTRMRSQKPKVLHTLAGKSFVQHVIDTASLLSDASIYIIIGHGAEQVKEDALGELSFIEQKEQLGTGHAVAQALPSIKSDANVLILYGDVPLIAEDTINNLLEKVSDTSIGLLTINLENPTGYGRIIRDSKNKVIEIVEQKDANSEQRLTKEINTGVMAFKGHHLIDWLPQLNNNNAQGEYYLTDLIAMADANQVDIETCQPQSEIEVVGVNNRLQQSQLERAYQNHLAEKHLEQGLAIADLARFDIRGELSHGNDCFIDINCVFEGIVKLGNNVTIGPGCILKNAKIGDQVELKANTLIEDSEVGNACVIGPFARLRPGTVLCDNAKIGNFVETKKAHVGLGSKINHLSYVGDAILGANVNVGAGTITCNYDGVNKSLTTIKDGAFIGSNTALVAPVTVGENATVGAGTVVTKDSEDGQLVVARAKQRNVDGWERPVKR